jgi:hypothetical protein
MCDFFPVIFIKYLCDARITYFFLSLRLKSFFFSAGICPNWGPTTRIPFRMYVVINIYSKSHGMLLRFTMPTKGGMYSSKTNAIYLTLARSSWCLLRFSVVWPECHPVDGDACNPSVYNACIPTYMNLSVMRSTSISSTDFSNMLCSPDIHTCNKINRVGERTSKVLNWMPRSRKNSVIYWVFYYLGYHSLQKVVPTQCPMG